MSVAGGIAANSIKAAIQNINSKYRFTPVLKFFIWVKMYTK